MPRPVRVVRIIDRLNVGGPARHVVWLTASLNPDEFATTLVTGSVAPGEGDMSYFAARHGVVPVVIPRMSRALGLGDVAVLANVLRVLWREKPDIVHTHKAKAGTIGRVAAWLYRWTTFSALWLRPRRCLVVHTFHGHVLHGYYGPATSTVFAWIERILARLATDTILVVSEQQRREINGRYKVGSPRQFHVVPLGVDPLPHDVLTRTVPWRPAQDGVSVIGAVGRLCEVKNFDMLLRVLARLKTTACPVHLVIVGDGHLRPSLEARARDLGVFDDITFTGFREDVDLLYATFDVAALTSLNEGTPLTLIEAMRAGVPIAATEVGGVSDIMGERREGGDSFSVWAHGVTAASLDVEGFAAGIRWLLAHPERRCAMGAAGEAFVQQRLSKDRLIRDIETLYRNLRANHEPDQIVEHPRVTISQ